MSKYQALRITKALTRLVMAGLWPMLKRGQRGSFMDGGIRYLVITDVH